MADVLSRYPPKFIEADLASPKELLMPNWFQEAKRKEAYEEQIQRIFDALKDASQGDVNEKSLAKVNLC